MNRGKHTVVLPRSLVITTYCAYARVCARLRSERMGENPGKITHSRLLLSVLEGPWSQGFFYCLGGKLLTT